MRISADGRRAQIANAGHHFPLLLSGGKVKALVTRGNRLGDVRVVQYDELEVSLEPSDALLLYTDGLTELVDAQGQEYGEKRLRRLWQQIGTDSVERSMQLLIADAQQFAGDVVAQDDVTFMTIRLA